MKSYKEEGSKIMAPYKEQFVVDSDGNRIGVVLSIADYKKILEAIEELEAIRAYDVAKASDDEAIPFDQAMEEIGLARK